MASLFSFGPGLLARLFGGDSNERLRRQVMALTNAGNVTRLTNQYFQSGLGSPAYSQALGTIAAGANQSANDVARNLAMSGIGSSGSGAVLSGLTPSLIGSQRAGLTSALYNASQQQAQNQIEQQLRALFGTQGPSYSGQLFGAGLAALGPMLQAYLQQRGLNYGTPSTSTGNWG